jgi:predicted DNA-binding transcriptional regulator AlpA
MSEVRGSEHVWGAKAIAEACGLSPSAIYRLSENPDLPFYKPPGTNRLYAVRSELKAWLCTKGPKKADES